jgi:hypothetical protein
VNCLRWTLHFVSPEDYVYEFVMTPLFKVDGQDGHVTTPLLGAFPSSPEVSFPSIYEVLYHSIHLYCEYSYFSVGSFFCSHKLPQKMSTYKVGLLYGTADAKQQKASMFQTAFSLSLLSEKIHSSDRIYNLALLLFFSSAAATSFNFLRRIFPLALLGISSTNRTPPLSRL